MRINYNASAMRANNALNVTDNKVSESLKKLSSGFKINSAKDNPAGYALGRRMNTQMEGVSVATRNANFGISVIETADGALSEIHDMLQRMNELAIKGATGTLTTADRMIVDAELQQLKKEVTRIAKDTEFNGQTLLDGSFELKGYIESSGANHLDLKVGYYSDEVLAKHYQIDALNIYYQDDGKIDLELTKNSFKAGEGFPPGVELTSVGENCVTFTNNEGFELTLDVTDGIGKASETFNSHENEGISGVVLDGSATGKSLTIESLTINYDTDGNLNWTINDGDFSFGEGFPEDATASYDANTNTIIITSASDPEFQVRFDVPNPNPQGTTDTPLTLQNITFTEGYGVAFKGVDLNITGIGSMDTQIGANEGQILKIRIPTISLQRLGLTNANVTTQDNSSDAIVAVKGAIAYVSDIRSRLGAYQNRLEHTVSSLDITNENMTAAYSRIMDVDMAEEMTNYTTQQVVEQAAVSMLAQANERPSQVLQLLQ